MANDATMVIKTTSATKALIKQAADRLGLSVNAFVVMTAKDAAGSDEITLRPKKSPENIWAEKAIKEWENSDKKTISREEFDKEFGF